MSAALETALADLKGPARDGAAVALARSYALALDESAEVHAGVWKALRDLADLGRQVGDAAELHDRLLVLAQRSETVHVLGLIGPKLNTVLADLGMTPRARASVTGGGGGTGGAPPQSPLARQRAEYGRSTAGQHTP
jgi:hypothetical protein